MGRLIDPWRSDLDEMLAENDRQPKRQRLTLVRIYEELRNRGYDGSYDEAVLSEHLAIGMAFVGVSLARSYLLRRSCALIQA